MSFIPSFLLPACNQSQDDLPIPKDQTKYIQVEFVELAPDGKPIYSYNDYQDALDKLNAVFSGANYHFYIPEAGIHHITNPLYGDDALNWSESSDVLAPFLREGVLTVFVADAFVDSEDNGMSGDAMKIQAGASGHFIRVKSYEYFWSTLIHETGHFGGLKHTHSRGGDKIDDTPFDRGGPDPDLSEPGICFVNDNCEVILCADEEGVLDPESDYPPTNNYMSYVPKYCRESLTPGQLSAWDKTMQALGKSLIHFEKKPAYTSQGMVRLQDTDNVLEALVGLAVGGVSELGAGTYDLSGVNIENKNIIFRAAPGANVVVKLAGITNSTIQFEGITFDSGGGGILVSGSKVNFNDCLFTQDDTQNPNPMIGPAVLTIFDSDALFNNCQWMNNVSYELISINTSQVSLIKCEISGNVASAPLGISMSEVDIQQTRIINNISSEVDAMGVIVDSTVTITDSEIGNNTANMAAWLFQSNLIIEGSVIHGQHSDDPSNLYGAILIGDNSTLEVSGTYWANNENADIAFGNYSSAPHGEQYLFNLLSYECRSDADSCDVSTR